MSVSLSSTRESNGVSISRRPLHLLILNAGVLNPQFRLTEDGYEEMFQVNYLSQVYLTAALLPAMLTTETHRPVRVIAVSCESHRVE
jgi:NAD(P)-dependent dehydrogenase (short-subunit alcohol dehydrogenase family)